MTFKFLEHILDAYGYCTSDQDFENLKAILDNGCSQLSADRSADWLYLKTRLPVFEQIKDAEELEAKHNQLVKRSSDLGYPPAQYQHGCRLYEAGNYEEAVKLYKLSADQGYPAAQYCYGLDRFNGVGVLECKDEGLEYIKLSAGRLYGLAIEFLIKHYRQDSSEDGYKNLQLYRKMWRWMDY